MPCRADPCGEWWVGLMLMGMGYCSGMGLGMLGASVKPCLP